MKDSQGAELRHVVETGDWNSTDVVVVQRSGRKRDMEIEKKGVREEKKETVKWKRGVKVTGSREWWEKS